MPRLSFTIVLPLAILAAVVGLFGQKAGFWGQPEPSTATAEAPPRPGTSDREQVEGPAANATLPGAEMNPVPAGTPDVQERRTPASALPTAPSGDPATRAGSN
jgi:hypothetical protein